MTLLCTYDICRLYIFATLNKSTARFGVKIKNDESFILNVYARASSSAFDPVSSR